MAMKQSFLALQAISAMSVAIDFGLTQVREIAYVELPAFSHFTGRMIHIFGLLRTYQGALRSSLICTMRILQHAINVESLDCQAMG